MVFNAVGRAVWRNGRPKRADAFIIMDATLRRKRLATNFESFVFFDDWRKRGKWAKRRKGRDGDGNESMTRRAERFSASRRRYSNKDKIGRIATGVAETGTEYG